MTSSFPSLPTPRHLLTSLFDTLTTTQTHSQTQNTLVNVPYDTPSNPLKLLPPSQRALLSTMHVLFTPPMLLQALDLLDRGLVLRVIETLPSTPTRLSSPPLEEPPLPEVVPPQANIHLRSSPPPPPEPNTNAPVTVDEKTKEKRDRNVIYQVRSSQPPKSRFKDATPGGYGGQIYTVRLAAWNCSCAAFAFASFPASSTYPSKPAWEFDAGDEDVDVDEVMGGLGVIAGERKEGDGEREEGSWEFGGLSADGRDGGNVPVCKHLLACVLGERWGVLKGYVKERNVGREEMAGLAGEG